VIQGFLVPEHIGDSQSTIYGHQHTRQDYPGCHIEDKVHV
jgi:hypothetical protein